MERISPKKKTNVQPAEKQESEPSERATPVPEVVIAQPEVHVEPAKETPKPSTPSIMDILKSTDPKMLETAQQFGIPLKALLQWCARREDFETQVKQAFVDIGKSMPTEEGIAAKLIAKAQTQQTQQPAPSQSGISVADVMGIVSKVLGSEGSNPMQNKVNSLFGAWLDKQMATIGQPSRFETLLDEELMKTKVKVAAKMISEGT